MKMLRANLIIPEFLAKIFKPFIIGNYWPEKECADISDMIENEQYDLAEIAIQVVIEKYGYSMKDVSDYATAVHAKELEALDIESGMTKDEIEAVLAKFGTPEMQSVHKGILQYNNKLIDMLQEGGILSSDAVKAMKEKYPNYVPFYRFFEDDIAQGLGNKGFANLTNPVKRLKGSIS